MRNVAIAESGAKYRTVYFDLVDNGGVPVTNQAGGQPQVSFNDLPFQASGISVLVHTGYGRYTATLDASYLTTAGDIIRTVYAASGVKTAFGDSFQVVTAESGSVDPAPGVISNLAYVTPNEADIFFGNRVNAVDWTAATVAQKQKALIQATGMIDRLNFAGELADSNQVLQFPRKNTFIVDSSEVITTTDVVVPASIKTATYLIAEKMLQGYDIDMEIATIFKSSTKIDKIQSSYDRSFIPEYLRAGIPSAEAWSYIRPYLANHKIVALVRVN